MCRHFMSKGGLQEGKLEKKEMGLLKKEHEHEGGLSLNNWDKERVQLSSWEVGKGNSKPSWQATKARVCVCVWSSQAFH